MSNDIEQLVGLISNILQPNSKQLREQAEAALVKLRTDRPNELILAFLSILGGQHNLEHRNFSATQLRLCLSEFSPSTYTNLWPTLTPQSQGIIKIQLFQIISKQKDYSMKKHIADTLGELAGSLLSTNNLAWPQFKVNIATLFQADIDSNLAAFSILTSFFSYAPDHFKEDSKSLLGIFQAALGHQTTRMKEAGLKCFASYLQVIDPKQYTIFQDLVIQIYKAVYTIVSNNSGNEEGLQILSEMIEIVPKFFKKKFKELNELLHKISQIPKLQSGVKRMATQILVDYAEKYPALFRKRKEVLTQLIEMIFTHMIQIQDLVTDQWKSPPEGYSDEMEDDEDFQTTRFGMGAVDRLIYSVGEEELLPILSQTIRKMLIQKDWRYKYTAVMALSQIGEYIEQPQKISSIMGVIINFLKDEHPMLRYSACHAIGQISDDMQPKFQETYGNVIFPQMLPLLQDSIPKIVSHAAAALTNFLQGMSFQQIESKIDMLMELLLFHSSKGISLVKESCLSTISSVAEVAGDKFMKYFSKTVQLLFSIFSTHQGKQYKQLKGQAIQTLTIIASSVGGESFQPVAGQLISLMIQIQSSQFQQVDPQKTYILAGWQRLCMVYGQKLAAYLDNILPSLFQLVENVISNELKLVSFTGQKQKQQKQTPLKEENEDNDNINTFETEEAEVAISMLNVFIEQLKQLYAPYVQKTVQLLCKIIKDHPNEDVKEEACKCLPNLIAGVKVVNPKMAVEMAKYFMETLVASMEGQFDTIIMIVELETLKDVIDELGLCFLTEMEVSAFCEKIVKLLKDSDEKKLQSKKYINEEDVDDQEKEMIGEEIKQQEEVQVAISQLIGVLFKTHKTMTISFAMFLIKNILPQAFKPNQSENMLKFGIFLIDDMVEFLGFEILHQNWSHFGEQLQQFTSHKSCVIRQAACYGLGIFASKTPSTVVNSILVESWLQYLIEGAKIPKGVQKQKTYGHCKDNAVAAIGKIIKTHANIFNPTPFLNIWLSMLPLRHDKPQAIQQHQFLTDIMINTPNLLLGTEQSQKLAKLTKVLNIYADICSNQKIRNQTVKIKMANYVRTLQSDNFFLANATKIGLSEKQKSQLVDLLK